MYISFVIQQSNRNIYMQKSGKEALCRGVDNFLEVGGQRLCTRKFCTTLLQSIVSYIPKKGLNEVEKEYYFEVIKVAKIDSCNACHQCPQ